MKNKLNRKRKYFKIEQNQSRKEEEENTNKIKDNRKWFKSKYKERWNST